MSIDSILYTDFLPIGFDKANANFSYLDTFGKELPKTLLATLAWGISPATLLDLNANAPTTATRSGPANYFNYRGQFKTAVVNEMRFVPGNFGINSAIRLEGSIQTTNILTQSVIIDTDSNGIANTWVRVGSPLDCVLSVIPSGITGDDQKILTADTLIMAGAETFTAVSNAFVNTNYMVSTLTKMIKGDPTDFKAIVRGYNNTSDLIYIEEVPMVLYKTLNNGYSYYIADVTTPDVTDFGNQIGFTLDTVSTVSVGIRLASTTEFTSQTWHTQIQENRLSEPLRTNGSTVTSESDNLSYTVPEEVSLAGAFAAWLALDKPTSSGSYPIFQSSDPRLTANGDGTLTVTKDATTHTFTPTVNVFDGNFHHFEISWDNYIDQYSIQHSPLMVSIDGAEQYSPLSPGVVLDPKTQRLAVDDAGGWAAQSSFSLSMCGSVDNPYLLARAIFKHELEHVYGTTVPVHRSLGVPVEVLKKQETIKWFFNPSTTSDLLVDGFQVTGGPQALFTLSWEPTEVVVVLNGTVVQEGYSWTIVSNQITFTPAIPNGSDLTIFGISYSPVVGSLPIVEVGGPTLVPFDCNILSAKLIIASNSGLPLTATEVDIKSNGTSIFSTLPAIQGTDGNYVISSNQVLNVTSLTQNAILTMDLTDFSTGVLSLGVELLVESL
jgi:hypothetical protein